MIITRKKIITKSTKATTSYIIITSNETHTFYDYITEDNNKGIKTTWKASANKYAFIEYLKGAHVPNKIIKEVEKYD